MSKVVLRVLGQQISLTAPVVSSAGSRADETLPFFYQLDDEVIAVAVRRAEAQGQSVSCRKGCSACCRAQPVPVTPPEAYHLARLVESLPEPRRTDILRRFEDNVLRLREADLDRHYLQRDPALGREEAREIARRYFALGLVCPFLQDDACGIYEHRPFVCRQYLVTSPPELCENPFDNPVRSVPIPMAPASALLRVTARMTGAAQFTVPLALALVLDEARREESERRYPAAVLFEEMLREVTTGNLA